jgi:sulfide:quinone oxidoreductase
MKPKIVVLGAGFGGLELSTILSETFGDRLDITLIDKSTFFYFGFSKFDVMFSHKSTDAVRLSYRNIVKPGVRFYQEEITAIDPAARHVTTNKGAYDADILVIALGADYDLEATPGLIQDGHEFYSFAGAERLRAVLPTFSKGRAVIGVTSVPFKNPPAPSEAALLLHEYLTEHGVRDHCEISLVVPFDVPIPSSPANSDALLAAFAERNIAFLPNRFVRALDASRHVAILDNEKEMPYDLFLGVPKHKAPAVVAASGMTDDNGWIPVNSINLKTIYSNVYAIGDVTDAGTPKTGVFAERDARIVAASILAEIHSRELPPVTERAGASYNELMDEKRYLESNRRARWFAQ